METLRQFFSETTPSRELACYSAADLKRILTPEKCFSALLEAYQNLAEDRESDPKTLGLKGKGGSFHIKAGLFPKTKTIFAAKLNANFPDNPQNGLPTIQGVLILFDATNGRPLAIMESSILTAIRTAATAALGAAYGAKKESQTLTIVGAGFQAGFMVEAFTKLFSFKNIYAFDQDYKKAQDFAANYSAKAVTNLKNASLKSDIIITVTSSNSPVLLADMVSPGTFIAAMGADNKEKNEVAPALFKKAIVLVDDLEKCVGEGDLQQAIEAGVITQEKVKGDLCQLVSGQRRGRTDNNEIVIFDSVGNGLQDVAAAQAVYFGD